MSPNASGHAACRAVQLSFVLILSLEADRKAGRADSRLSQPGFSAGSALTGCGSLSPRSLSSPRPVSYPGNGDINRTHGIGGRGVYMCKDSGRLGSLVDEFCWCGFSFLSPQSCPYRFPPPDKPLHCLNYSPRAIILNFSSLVLTMACMGVQ